MYVIWYNTTQQTYQLGSYEEFKLQMAACPEQTLPLEKFKNEPVESLTKIINKLNKQ